MTVLDVATGSCRPVRASTVSDGQRLLGDREPSGGFFRGEFDISEVMAMAWDLSTHV